MIGAWALRNEGGCAPRRIEVDLAVASGATRANKLWPTEVGVGAPPSAFGPSIPKVATTRFLPPIRREGLRCFSRCSLLLSSGRVLPPRCGHLFGASCSLPFASRGRPAFTSRQRGLRPARSLVGIAISVPVESVFGASVALGVTCLVTQK